MTYDELKAELAVSEQIRIELMLHSQRLAEHVRTQMDIVLEVVRSSTDLYTEHVAFMHKLVGSDDKDNNKTTSEI